MVLPAVVALFAVVQGQYPSDPGCLAHSVGGSADRQNQLGLQARLDPAITFLYWSDFIFACTTY